MTTHEKPNESECCSVVRAGLRVGQRQELLDLGEDLVEEGGVDRLEAHARPPRRHDPERRLEREGGVAEREEAVEVGALGRALAAQDVEQAHRRPRSGA